MFLFWFAALPYLSATMLSLIRIFKNILNEDFPTDQPAKSLSSLAKPPPLPQNARKAAVPPPLPRTRDTGTNDHTHLGSTKNGFSIPDRHDVKYNSVKPLYGPEAMQTQTTKQNVSALRDAQAFSDWSADDHLSAARVHFDKANYWRDKAGKAKETNADADYRKWANAAKHHDAIGTAHTRLYAKPTRRS